jgi:hypothetical protein
MLKKYSPVDLRKASTGGGDDVSLRIFHESEIIHSSFDAVSFYQESNLEGMGLEEKFTNNYIAPEAYYSIVSGCTIGPRLAGLSRYWPFFFGESYVWNFINSLAKKAYEEKGIFRAENDVIYWDEEKYPTLKIPGLSVWFYPFGNLDHFLRECLPAIIFLKEEGIRFSEINFICSEISSSFYAFLIDIGIPASSIIVTGNRWIYCEKIILPCFGSFGHLHTPGKYYSLILNEILSRVSKGGVGFQKRIYVSRMRARARKIINEEVIEEGLKKRGFMILDPGDYSIRDQVNLFKDASFVLGPHGMGIANYGFAKDDSSLFEIMQSNCPRVSYYRTAQLKNGRYSVYWAAPVSPEYCNDGDVYGSVLLSSAKFFSALDKSL